MKKLNHYLIYYRACGKDCLILGTQSTKTFKNYKNWTDIIESSTLNNAGSSWERKKIKRGCFWEKNKALSMKESTCYETTF